MKPLKLTIKGLNSFAEAQTIDFEELSSKGIFGIFGPTGSGKSTILDGITLALYGDLARKSNGFVNSKEEVRQANISLVFQISGPNPRIFQVDRTFVKNKDASRKPVSKSVLKEIQNDRDFRRRNVSRKRSLRKADRIKKRGFPANGRTSARKIF